MNYQTADSYKKKSLTGLIANRLLQGQGLKAISSSVSDKWTAKKTRMKGAFDPLRMMKFMMFGSNFMTAAAGKAMGRSSEDIEYFSGYKGVNRKRKSTSRTSMGPGRVQNLRAGDSTADILGKMYNFMQKSYDEEKKRYELEKNFWKEEKEEAERRHKKLVDALLGAKSRKVSRTGDVKEVGTDTEFMGPLQKTIAMLTSKMAGMATWVGSFMSKVALMAVEFIGFIKSMGSLSKVFKMLAGVTSLADLVGNLLFKLLPTFAPWIAATAVAAVVAWKMWGEDFLKQDYAIERAVKVLPHWEMQVDEDGKPIAGGEQQRSNGMGTDFRNVPKSEMTDFKPEVADELSSGKKKLYEPAIPGDPMKTAQVALTDQEAENLGTEYVKLRDIKKQISKQKDIPNRTVDQENRLNDLKAAYEEQQTVIWKLLRDGTYGTFKSPKNDVAESLNEKLRPNTILGRLGEKFPAVAEAISGVTEEFDSGKLVRSIEDVVTAGEAAALALRKPENGASSSSSSTGQVNSIGAGAPRTVDNTPLDIRNPDISINKPLRDAAPAL